MVFENKYYNILELDKIINNIISLVDLNKSKELLENIVLENDIDIITNKLNEVNEALILLNRMGKFQIYFKNDVSFYLSKIHKNGLINSLELADIGNYLDTIRDLYLYFDKLEDNKIACDYLKIHLNNFTYIKELNLKIKNIVTPYGEIKDDASLKLKSIRKSYTDCEKNIQTKIQDLLQTYSSKLTQNVISLRNDRYVLPVKSDYKNQVKGIIHDESSSGETVYIEPLVVCQLNNKMASLKEEEKREIENILKNISTNIDLYYDELMLSYDELVYLDIVFGKALYAKSYEGMMPCVNKNGIVELNSCFHPLLNVSHIVKNNIILGKDYQGIIITGPNTGGKTVLLKTLGLLSLMVKCSLLLPCKENSNIMIFDDVYADIGDEQSINQNLSTFSSHMKNVINIINNVNENSLVLLDELGSGTDPVEGSSLAISIFDYLLSKKCLLVATSHYSELKIHAYNSNNIINASVEFDVNSLKPTYRLLIGVPGMSNAINVSKNLGMKKEILDSALEYVYKKNDNLNLVLDKMINQSNLLDKRIQEVEEEKILLKEKIKEKDQEINKNIEERNKIIIQANKEKDKIINDSKEKLEELFEELKSLKNRNIKTHEIADIKHKIRELDNNNLDEETIKTEIPLEVGLNVFIKGYNTYGKITKILSNNKCEVSIGVVSMKIDNDDLIPSSNKEIKSSNTEKVNRNTNNTINLKKSVSSRLDLRGTRYEEAKELLDKYLDDALYASLSSVTIIHGFGTGTIRKLVQETLKNSSNVLEFRYGGEKEGGLGATIVSLKTK